MGSGVANDQFNSSQKRIICQKHLKGLFWFFFTKKQFVGTVWVKSVKINNFLPNEQYVGIPWSKTFKIIKKQYAGTVLSKNVQIKYFFKYKNSMHEHFGPILLKSKFYNYKNSM